MVAIISILSCIAVMAVGVYAASSSFAVTVENEISVQIEKVDGRLYGKRGGDVIYGTVSMGDSATGFSENDLASTDRNPNASEISNATGKYLYLYGNRDTTGFKVDEENMEEIQKPVNFYTQDKESLTMYYVFKFIFQEGSPTNVMITLTNLTDTSNISDLKEGSVVQSYKYVQGNSELAEPDWDKVETEMTFVNNVNTINVIGNDPNKHVVYIYASLTVKRTNTFADAFVIGEKFNKPFNWKFTLAFDATTTQNV